MLSLQELFKRVREEKREDDFSIISLYVPTSYISIYNLASTSTFWI